MKRSSIAGSIGFLAFVACADNTGPPTPVGPTTPVGLKVITVPSQAAETMIPLATQPVLQLVDGSGDPVAVAGTMITAFAGGAGKIFGGGSATTDASGTAKFATLMLGANNGVVGPTTLSFGTAGQMSLTTQTQLACAIRNIELGGTVVGELTIGDCKRVPPAPTTAFFKEHRLNVTAATKAIRLSHSATFHGLMLVRGPNEPTLFFGQSNSGPFDFKVFVPPGTSTILETAPTDGTTGSFSFSVTAAPEDEPECEVAQFQSPLITNQTLRPACKDAAGTNVADFFTFDMLDAGSVSVSVTSSAFAPKVLIRRFSPTDSVVAIGTLSGNTASATHVNHTGVVAYYYVVVTSSDGTGTGAYTVQATITNPTGSAVRSSSGVTPSETGGSESRPQLGTWRPNEMSRTQSPLFRRH